MEVSTDILMDVQATRHVRKLASRYIFGATIFSKMSQIRNFC